MKFITAIIASTILFLFGQTAWAADYYVSNSGNDTSAGTQSSPWAHCPGMAGWNGSASLVPGDKVYFNSAQTWTLNSGSQGLMVEGGVSYIGDEWGDGTIAKFDAVKSYGQARAVVLMIEDDDTYQTVFKGFEVDGNDLGSRLIFINNGDLTSGYLLDGAVKRVENCDVHHSSSSQSGYYYGIIASVNEDSTISNLELINNTIHDADHSVMALYAGYNVSNAHIYNVIVRGNTSYGGYVDTTTSGAGLLIKNHVENVVVEENHFFDNGNGIVIERVNAPSGTSGPTAITIRNNIIEKGTNGKGVGIYAHGGASQDVKIYNNLIFNNPNSGIKFESNLSGTLSYRIYNNTLFNNALVISGGSFSVLEVKNNILYPSSITGYTSRITSQSNNLSTNPNFKDTSNLPEGFTGTHGIDLEPDNDGLSTESGDSIGSGVNLGSSYNSSINSLVRPSSGNWDIGAYEHVDETQDNADIKPLPPTNLKIFAVF